MPRSSPRLIPINRPLPHARAVLRCVCCIHAAVVLNGVLLDVLPHLLDGSVERLVCLFLRRDEVVGVVGGLLGCAAGDGGGGGCVGGVGGAGGGEGEDAGVGVEVVHCGGWCGFGGW
jgi:hypothetical protein